MKSVLEVCLISLGFVSAALGQSTTPSISIPTLRKGISVQMPVTENAITEPEADKEDALVVVLTRTGASYLVTIPITPAALAKRIASELRNSQGRQLYLKADSRTPYADVARILRTVQRAGVTAPVLLTSQGQPRQPERPVAPEGLPVLLGPATGEGEPAVVQLLNSGQQQPMAKVDGKEVAWPNLQSALEQASQHSGTKIILVKADGRLPFEDIVHVADVCRPAGIQVILFSTGV